MIRKNLIKSLSVVMAAMLAIMTVACGANTTEDASVAVEETAGEKELEDSIIKSTAGASDEAGKVETVYVTADANGAVDEVIVSEWLKNADASDTLSDTTTLQNIVNVKGDESYTDNGDGTLTWNAKGSDIYYQGTTAKELPVKMKVSYKLDGKDISPEELAGKSGKVTIRFDYENNDKQTVDVDGKEIEVYTPFAMISGMTLDPDKFSEVEVSNGKVISEGGNIIVLGIALPGLKDSLDVDEDKWDELNEDGDLDSKLANYFEVTANTTDFELGMTITMASSDVLSDFGITDITESDKINDLKDDMGELNDASDKLVDANKELKDGTGELKDGVGELYDGTSELKDGTLDFYNGIVAYTDATSKINEGASALADGASQAHDGTHKMKKAMDEAKLVENANKLADGSKQVSDGVATVAKMAESLSGLSDSVKELNDQKAAFEATAAWLKNGGDCSPAIVACMYKLTNGGIDSAAKAVAWRNAHLNAVVELTKLGGYTVTATPVPSGDEAPERDVTEGELTRDGSGDNNGDSNNGNGSGYNGGNSGSGSEGSGSDTGSGNAGSGDSNGNGGAGAGSSDTGSGNSGSGDGGNSGSNAGAGNNGSGNSGGDNGGSGSGSGAAGGSSNGSGSGSNGDNGGSSAGAGNAGGAGDNAGAENGDNVTLNPNGSQQPAGDGMTAEEKAAMLAGSQLTVNANNLQQGAGLGAMLYSVSPVDGSISYDQGEIAGYVQAANEYYSIIGAAQGMANALGAVIQTMSSATGGSTGMTPEAAKQLQQLVLGAQQVAEGNKALAGGLSELYDGTSQLDEGLGKLSDGAKQLSDGTGTLVSNNEALVDGAYKLNDGTHQLGDGVKELYDGVIELDDGVQELVDGVIKFDEEGIDKLYEVFDGDLTEFTDKLTAIQKAGSEYKTFGGAADDIDSSVKFIIRTDGIKEA
ncbi:hypothetical protein [Butyrivibrio sp. INlla21]|uniref:hypothetical protein n=1 Tax=Butyrivibrio sp. INlla21 TaxID=1520811 RepID=UPI0008F07443|nr:hypothetical protein [Butyrivibrio sp. INlla21]SFU78228.1 putative membrane protein [Butyrivibrio sp. INlla21]